MQHRNIENVSTFIKLTDRSLYTSQRLAHFDHKKFPKNALILNLGSGTKQVLESQLLSSRKDLQIISIDPSIFMSEYKATDVDGYTIKITSELIEMRLNNLLNRNKTLVALGQFLPLASSTFDVLLDVRGPAMYATNFAEYQRYIVEVMRVLKDNGQAYISQLFDGAPIINKDSDINYYIDIHEKIFKKMEIKAQVFAELDNNFTGQKDYRIGAILSK